MRPGLYPHGGRSGKWAGGASGRFVCSPALAGRLSAGRTQAAVGSDLLGAIGQSSRLAPWPPWPAAKSGRRRTRW